jgi:hypothetical protein
VKQHQPTICPGYALCYQAAPDICNAHRTVRRQVEEGKCIPPPGRILRAP